MRFMNFIKKINVEFRLGLKGCLDRFFGKLKSVLHAGFSKKLIRININFISENCVSLILNPNHSSRLINLHLFLLSLFFFIYYQLFLVLLIKNTILNKILFIFIIYII